MPKRTTESRQTFRQTSWWIVLIAGTLCVVFVVAIIREVINGHQVRTQVGRLQAQVAAAQQHQRQLNDLIDYLQSPTFQERQARLQLGLKKSGESVMVVPTLNDNSSTTTQPSSATTETAANIADQSHAGRWWTYFFGSTAS